MKKILCVTLCTSGVRDKTEILLGDWNCSTVLNLDSKMADLCFKFEGNQTF